MPMTLAAPAFRARLVTAVWSAGVTAAALLLPRLGADALAPPGRADLGDLVAWIELKGPGVAVFAVVRVACIAAAWYLAGSTALGLAARASRRQWLVRWADVVTVPAVRRMLGNVAGLGVTASLATGALVHGVVPAGAAVAAVAHVVPVSPAAAEPAGAVLRGPGSTGVPRLERLVDEPGTGSTGDATMVLVEDDRASLEVTPTATREDRPGRSGRATSWVVRPGDHLWHVAESTLAASLGRPVSDGEVAPFWTAVVDANRSRLADPGNPDLLLPGQVLTVPAPPAPG